MKLLMLVFFFGMCGIFLAFLFSKFTQKIEKQKENSINDEEADN